MHTPKWLNRNIAALGLISLFSDASYEMATAILPAFLASIGGSAATLGLIEGISDASISFMKAFSGWYSDALNKRKPFAVIGYALTAVGVGSFFLATRWYHVLMSRMLSWFGKGVREPARDALLVESTTPPYYGRMFGFHRAMDTVGAIIGPLCALVLINFVPLRYIFLIALIPSIICVAIIALFVKEKIDTPQELTHQSSSLFASIKDLPHDFMGFVATVGIFGFGNFAASLLILRTIELLTPTIGALHATSFAILCYTGFNIIYASCALPMGYLADAIGKRNILAVGYFLTACSSLGFGLATSSTLIIVVLFLVAGMAISITDAVERSIAADLLPAAQRGTGYGFLAMINGCGDFASSIAVGFLWNRVSPIVGFGYSAALCLVAAFFLIRTVKHTQ